ncbi:hypothetical protein BY996DRAFT_4570281, partial [Phakopsora pachyrhizi]
IYDQCQVEGSFALTFDDGLGQYSGEVNQLLEEYDIRTTFFVNGNNAACIYDYADEMRARISSGHLLANHGWSHAHMASLSREEIVSEVERVEEAFIKILGLKPLYFRPPYGKKLFGLSVLSERGYKGLIMWSQDSGDSLNPAPSSEEIVSDYENYPSKTIVLNHEISQQTVESVMPSVIPALKERFSLQTVSECLGLGNSQSDYYGYVSEPGNRD